MSQTQHNSVLCPPKQDQEASSPRTLSRAIGPEPGMLGFDLPDKTHLIASLRETGMREQGLQQQPCSTCCQEQPGQPSAIAQHVPSSSQRCHIAAAQAGVKSGHSGSSQAWGGRGVHNLTMFNSLCNSHPNLLE